MSTLTKTEVFAAILHQSEYASNSCTQSAVTTLSILCSNSCLAAYLFGWGSPEHVILNKFVDEEPNHAN